MNKFGLGNEFIQNLKGPAGPLYSYLHYLFYPISQGAVIPTRLLNVFLIVLTTITLYILLLEIKPDIAYSALLICTIPMIFPTVGMALTEVPALLFFTLFLFGLVKLEKANEKTHQYIWTLIAAFSFSLAVSGRQPYLPVIGLLFFAWIHKELKLRIANVIILVITSLIYPAYLFLTWNGLAPKEGGDYTVKNFLSFPNLLIAFGYTSLIMVILSRQFYIELTKSRVIKYLLIGILSSVIYYFLDVGFIPMKTLFERVFNSNILLYLGALFVGFLTGISAFFMESLAHGYRQNSTNIWYFISALGTLIIVFTCIRITHQFSSRYVFQAAPLMIILSTFTIKNDFKQRFLWGFGFLLGIISLIGYY